MRLDASLFSLNRRSTAVFLHAGQNILVYEPDEYGLVL